MTVLETVALGLGGKRVAGLIGWAIRKAAAPGIVISVLCSTAIPYVIRRRRREPQPPGGTSGMSAARRKLASV